MRLSAPDALERLRRGEGLRDVEIDALDVPVTGLRLERCKLQTLRALFIEFTGAVEIVDCTIETLDFNSAYFPDGLSITRSTIGSADFQCGGHNKRDFALADTTFTRFVNFFDCWFQGPVIVRGCRFGAGTNLLGNRGGPVEVQFDVPPRIEDNVGALDLDGG